MLSDSSFTPDGGEQHRQLIIALIQELFLDQRRLLAKWTRITNQSAQLDSGYIAQHLISLLTGVKGIRRRGKGLDLSDGSCAAIWICLSCCKRLKGTSAPYG